MSHNLTADSDRVQALVVGAGPIDSGGDQSRSIYIGNDNEFPEKIDPFTRRDSITRTSPRSRSNSCPWPKRREVDKEGTAVALMDRETKRKRVDSPNQTSEESSEEFFQRMRKEYSVFKNNMLKGSDETKNLQAYLIRVQNTKKEIKTSASNLKLIMEKMEASVSFIDEMFDMLAKSKFPRCESIKNVETSEASTQTGSKSHEERGKLARKLEQELTLKHDEHTLNALIEVQWPQEIFKMC